MIYQITLMDALILIYSRWAALVYFYRKADFFRRFFELGSIYMPGWCCYNNIVFIFICRRIF